MATDPQTLPRLVHDASVVAQRFHDGDVGALRALMERHGHEVFTHALRMLGAHEDAHDVAQEVALKCLENHHRFDPRRPFRPWVLRIATNLCRDRLRTVWWRRVVGLERAPELEDLASPEGASSGAERDRMVRHALSTLPVQYREVLSLFHLQDLHYSEIAEITGVSVPALKQRVRRGSAMLRDAVQRLYPDLVPGRTHG